MRLVVLVAVLATAACNAGSATVAPEDELGEEVSSGEQLGSRQRGAIRGGVSQGSSNREDDMADAPQEMAGAFLTCAKSQGPEEPNVSVFGCRVENAKGMVNIGRFDAAWTLADRKSNRDTDSTRDAIKVMPMGSIWHAEFRLPKLEEKNLKARVSFKFDGGRTGSISKAFDDANLFLRPSQRKVYYIGDESLLGRLIGSCRIELTKPNPIGTTLTFNIVVEAGKTSLKIDIGGLCGVNYDTNIVSLKNPKGEVLKKQNMVPGIGTMRLETPALDPGTYSLEIAAGSGIFGTDHFIAQDILVSYPVGETKIRIEAP